MTPPATARTAVTRDRGTRTVVAPSRGCARVRTTVVQRPPRRTWTATRPAPGVRSQTVRVFATWFAVNALFVLALLKAIWTIRARRRRGAVASGRLRLVGLGVPPERAAAERPDAGA